MATEKRKRASTTIHIYNSPKGRTDGLPISFRLLFSFSSSLLIPPSLAMRFRVDIAKGVVVSNFQRRGWTRTDGDDWDIYWATVTHTYEIFHPGNGIRLGDNQRVNHFPNHYELTRKDHMVRHLRRYRRELERESRIRDTTIDFIPTTFILPGDYNLLLEEYKRSPSVTWILKPPAKARGIGIFLIKRLTKLKKWATARFGPEPSMVRSADIYVVSRYVDRPLLVGGRKFDVRLYALVMCFNPLVVYKFRHGFARFCSVQYTTCLDELDNRLVHLTNVSVQKHADDYDERHGGKWALENLRLFLEGTRGKEVTDRLFQDVDRVVVTSLKAVQNVIVNDPHCFECYGYDILIDEDLKPWLIEVNASPALGATTPADRQLKQALINDVLEVVFHPAFVEGKTNRSAAGTKPRVVGGFTLIFDETRETDTTKKREAPRIHRARRAGHPRAPC